MDPVALVVQQAHRHPWSPFLLGDQPDRFLLACLATLANLVFLIQAILVGLGVQVGPQDQAAHSLEVQVVLEVLLVQVARLALVLLGESLQHH